MHINKHDADDEEDDEDADDTNATWIRIVTSSFRSFLFALATLLL